MRVAVRGLLVLAIVLTALATANAAVVTTAVVKPSTLADTGWTVAVQGGAPYEWTGLGPGMAPAGEGAFHFKGFYSAADPLKKIYLGTNLFSGRSLRDIVTFRYYTWLAARDYGSSGNPLGQPPVIEINTDSGSTVQQREFVYKPYGWYGGSNVGLNKWQEWDLMGAGGQWEMYHTGSTNFHGDWSWVTNRYGSETTPMRFQNPLVGDYNSAAGPNNELSNVSGTSISIRVGSSKAVDKYWNYNADPAAYIQPYGWWREAAGIDAYADKLVIGFMDGDEYTFDFEADTGAQGTYAITGKDTKTYSVSGGKKMFYYVVFGVAVTDPNISLGPDEFLLYDGSRKVKVNAPGAIVIADQGYFYRAKGVLDNVPDPAVLYSNTDNILRYVP